jgi:epoxyqueuosine reductase
MSHFSYVAPADLTGAKTLFVLAMPQPLVRVKFWLHQKSYRFVIPPTYSHTVDERVKRLMAGILNRYGYHLVDAYLPVKLIAVHSGLARYGRNNIAYVEGMGSFHRLRVFFSDLPASEDNWHTLKALDHCENCNACMNSCPTGAINEDRFLISAQKCLTFVNENEWEFPQWVDPSWHHCLVGCMRCQSSCPYNRDFTTWVHDREEFSEEETQQLLNPEQLPNLPQKTLKKLKKLGLYEYLNLIPRNLGVLLENYRQFPH